MKRLIIGIDCDDVLLQNTRYVVPMYNKLYGTSVQLKDAHAQGNTDWGLDTKEIHDRLDAIQLSEEYSELIPELDAVRVVNALSKNHELHLVTARSGSVFEVTKRMLDEYFAGCFTSIDHVGQARTKGQACQAIRAEVLINDNCNYLQEAKECGVEHLIWFGDYEWQSDQVAPAGISRCTDWISVEKEIERIAGK